MVESHPVPAPVEVASSGAGGAVEEGLAGMRVLDFSGQIAGPYCSKLFADAGATVIKVEPPGGDPLRRAVPPDAAPSTGDSPLFAFLNAGKQSITGSAGDAHVAALVAGADLVIDAHGLEGDVEAGLDPEALRAAHPSLVVVTITPYGCTGPWAGRPANEFTLQAESGSIGVRALMGGEPFQAGGRIGEWAAGSYAAAAALPAVLGARTTGRGGHVDLSILEVANFVFTNYSETMNRLMNGSPDDPEHAFLAPSVETPSVEPTADGYVGFCTNSRQQFSDFLLLIERPDLQDDEALAQFAGRLMRFEEWTEIMRPWLSRHTTAEIIELASLLRIPVAPVCNGRTVLEQEQLVARGVFVDGADGRFRQPRRPYRIDDADPPPPRPAPRLGEHGERAAFPPRETPSHATQRADAHGRPLEGLRILDLTAWWAGPSATHLLATFGAEVIHVESASRPDGMRMIGGMMRAHYEPWWDASPHFLHANSNKLGVTLDLSTDRGIALLERLVAKCDAVVENFTPRVLENLGLTWARVQELNPRAVLARMPAFGLSGPWRDRPGFAQTMEQLSGLAWVTGHTDDQPRIPRGPCDPVAGMHAAFAILVALEKRRRSGRGHLVESTMVESALNIATEQVLAWSAHGILLDRQGNRSPLAAPQGLYPCADGERPTEGWLALSIASDAQWRALCEAIGRPAWAMDPALETLAGRRAAHDAIDARLSEYTRRRPRAELVAELRANGVLASGVADTARILQTSPQLRARRYFEACPHPVVGAMPLPSLPFRYTDVEHWLRTPAPTLGRDNEAVLCGLLGLSTEELRALEHERVIGSRPEGL